MDTFVNYSPQASLSSSFPRLFGIVGSSRKQPSIFTSTLNDTLSHFTQSHPGDKQQMYRNIGQKAKVMQHSRRNEAYLSDKNEMLTFTT